MIYVMTYYYYSLGQITLIFGRNLNFLRDYDLVSEGVKIHINKYNSHTIKAMRSIDIYTYVVIILSLLEVRDYISLSNICP